MEIPFTVVINKTTINVTDYETWRKAVTRGDAFFAAIMGDEFPLPAGPIATIAIQERPKRTPPPRPEGPTKAELAETVLRAKREFLTTTDLASAMVEAGWKTESQIGVPRNRTLENPLVKGKDTFVKKKGKWGLVEWGDSEPQSSEGVVTEDGASQENLEM